MNKAIFRTLCFPSGASLRPVLERQTCKEPLPLTLFSAGAFQALFVTLILLCLLTHAYSQQAKGFHALGTLDCTFYDSAGGLFATQHLNFEIRVEGSHWLLINPQTNGNRWIRGSDGASVYHVLHEVAKNWPKESGLVEPGPMPWGGYPSALVWLALASSEHLDSPDLLFAPWADPYFEPCASAYDLAIRRSEFPPMLPLEVHFVVSKSRIDRYQGGPFFKREGASSSARRAALQRIASESPGFLGGRYRVLSHTNLNGLHIPQIFELTVFRPAIGPPGMSSNAPVSSTFKGTVTNCSTASLVESLPDVTRKPISVSDLRFRDPKRPMDSLLYDATNRWVTSTNDPRLLALKARKLASLPRFAQDDWRRYVILMVLGAVAIGPPVVWMAINRTRRKRLRQRASANSISSQSIPT